MTLKGQKRIYLDYMASTPVDSRVQKAMEPYWAQTFAHPWALHKDGLAANDVFKESTKTVAKIIDARPEEFVFTSSGTESTTQAIKGLLEFIHESNGTLEGLHIIVSSIEHPSVGGVVEYAQHRGMEVTLVGVGERGIVNLKEIRDALRPETVLVSIMYVNSEIGTIQPIKEISKIIKNHRRQEKNAFYLPNLDFKFPAFHTDASQAALYLDCGVDKLGVDMMTLDAHKIYGPKGAGGLYVRNGILLKPLFFGHSQDSYLRNGTPAIPHIVGFAKAFEIASEEREKFSESVKEVRDYLIERIEKEIPVAKLNGDRELRAPHNASFSFEEINHEFLAVQLDEKGISVATRSACSAADGDKSHVLEELFNHRESSAVRFSIGKETTKEDVDYVVTVLKKSLNIA